jgi:hypothetical protein
MDGPTHLYTICQACARPVAALLWLDGWWCGIVGGGQAATAKHDGALGYVYCSSCSLAKQQQQMMMMMM